MTDEFAAEHGRRPLPWWWIGVTAAVGLGGVVLSLSVAYWRVALGVLAWLAVVGGLGYLVARARWELGGEARDAPARAEVLERAARGRARGTERWEATRRAVDSGLVGPGFTRGRLRPGHVLEDATTPPTDAVRDGA